MIETNTPAIHHIRAMRINKLKREIANVTEELQRPLPCESDRQSLIAEQSRLIEEFAILTDIRSSTAAKPA